jgi:hypothetical protein
MIFRIFPPITWGLALLTWLRNPALLLTRFLARTLVLLAGLVLVRHVVSFHGTPYQRPGFLGVPKKEKSNYDLSPLFGDGEDIFAFAVLVKADASLM